MVQMNSSFMNPSWLQSSAPNSHRETEAKKSETGKQANFLECIDWHKALAVNAQSPKGGENNILL